MNMSFALTTDAVRNYGKYVTRRYGWANVRPAQIIWAVEKSQGLALGERVKPICEIQIIGTPRWEQLDLMITDQAYGEAEVILEGFPDLTPVQFVEMICDHNKTQPDNLVHRLPFRYLLRSAAPSFTFDGETHTMEIDEFQYHTDGTLVGRVRDDPTGEINQMLMDAFRFEL